ncbi:MAG: hypothetical protein PHN88_09295 [Ignavibacteria bacterium]|nr:hypothetical protein [Ignavibacteria bacterium]
MEHKRLNRILPALPAVIFITIYLSAVILLNVLLNADYFKSKLIHVDSKVVIAKWVDYEQK